MAGIHSVITRGIDTPKLRCRWICLPSGTCWDNQKLELHPGMAREKDVDELLIFSKCFTVFYFVGKGKSFFQLPSMKSAESGCWVFILLSVLMKGMACHLLFACGRMYTGLKIIERIPRVSKTACREEAAFPVGEK